MIGEIHFGNLVICPGLPGLEDVGVKVLAVKAEAPEAGETNGYGHVDVRFALRNGTQNDWECLVVRMHLLNHKCQVILEDVETHEETLAAGEEAEFESGMRVDWRALGESPEQAGILVTVTACGMVFDNIGEFPVPGRSFEMVEFKPVKLGNVLRLVGGGFCKEETTNPGEALLVVRALVQNLTSSHLHEVKIMAEVVDRANRRVTDADTSVDLPPGGLILLHGSGFADKEKQFRGAKLRASLRAYFPLANGADHRSGFEIIGTAQGGD